MLTRTIRKSILDVRIPLSALPPTFLLSNRSRYFHSPTQHVESPEITAIPQAIPNASTSSTSVLSSISPRLRVSTPPTAESTPTDISASIQDLLPLLSAQPNHFISAHIHGRPYLVTAGDTVRLPFRMPGVVPGDVLRLNRASSLGSRDYTLKGVPYLDERLFECRATVVGTEGEPMREKIKKKQRTRRTHTVKSKHKFTVLRISELKINEVEGSEA